MLQDIGVFGAFIVAGLALVLAVGQTMYQIRVNRLNQIEQERKEAEQRQREDEREVAQRQREAEQRRREEKLYAELDRKDRLAFLVSTIVDRSIPKESRQPFYDEFIALGGNGTVAQFWIKET